MGLGDMIKQNGMPQQSGGEVAARVAAGEADLGMTLIAEIVPVKGARVLGPLPAPLGNATTYCAGVMSISAAPDAALAFIAALTRSEASDVWTSAGFELP
jgi:molybdate transport system substrate-binding protein